MLAINSSSGKADSEPEHFRTREIKDKSLRKVVVPIDIWSPNVCISALTSCNSAIKRVSAIVPNKFSIISSDINFYYIALLRLILSRLYNTKSVSLNFVGGEPTWSTYQGVQPTAATIYNAGQNDERDL